MFVRGQAESADANVVAFATGNDLSSPLWALAAGGAFTVRTAAGSRVFDLSSAIDLAGGWHHFAVSYASAGGDTEVKAYWDHELALEATVPGALDFSAAAGYTVGSAGFAGAVDELRVRAGVYAPADFLYAAPPRSTMMLIR